MRMTLHHLLRTQRILGTSKDAPYEKTDGGKKACVLRFGCPESGIDSARVQIFLRKNRYTITKKWKEADRILLRTCGLTEGIVDRSLKAIGNIQKKMKKGAEFHVWGCLPTIDLEALRTVYEGVTFGEKDVGILNEIVGAKVPIEKVKANFILPEYRPTDYRSIAQFLFETIYRSINPHYEFKPDKHGFHFDIKVSTGCLYGGYDERCAYCAVRKARGNVKSESIEEIMTQFEKGLEFGFKDFHLMGTDLGATGRDRGYTLAELVNRMIDRARMLGVDIVLSLKNLNAHWLIRDYTELRPILNSGKIRYLATPVEHASNRMLQKMRRGYTIEEFNSIIEDINWHNPDMLLCTQVLVGFPGETDKDHEQNEIFVSRPLFDTHELYMFSPRPGTPAAVMDSQVSESMKTVRYMRLMFMSTVSMVKRKITRLYK